jgi:ribosomal protein S18 acetylase RimI-like enzyme
MEVTFRPARPEDAEAMAPLVYSSGPAAFDYVFTHGTRVPAVEFVHRSLPSPGGEFGHDVHVVGELGGEVVATGASYSGQAHVAFMMSAIRRILGIYGPIPGARVLARGLRFESVVPPPRGAMHYISHIGVRRDVWGKGVGERLMRHLLEQGRVEGRKLAVLDVSAENPRAQALYERLGFVVTGEKRSRLENASARVPDHRRMELRL